MSEDSLMRRISLGTLWVILAITLALLASVAMLVDLSPVVDQNFSFQPTLLFLAGCVIDILANLFVLPLLAGAQLKKRV